MTTFDFKHAIDVASRVEGSAATLVALFHDAVEDGLCSFEALGALGIPGYIIETIETLTRRDGEAYAAYIERVKSGGDLARQVKLADLDANLARLDSERASLESRYRKAIERLTSED